jgi:ABC-type multidrug transport system fused ATPase/permease subunit
MEHKNFVTPEEVSAEQQNVKTILRFVSGLTLLKQVLVPTLLIMVCAAAAPPYFLWFVGELVGCYGEAGCSVTQDLLGYEMVIPATLSTLLMIAVIAMFCRVAAWSSFELAGQWSTQKIQSDMMTSVSEVKTTFFDENPSGRLLNRLLGDYGMLRLEGVMSVGDTVNGLAEVLCVGLLIMLAHPVAGLMILPVVLLYVALQSQLAPMMSHSREIRAVKLGEALHRETDLIEGRTIFSLYNRQKNLLKRIHRAYGESLNIQLFYARLIGWGMLWMGLISAFYSTLVYGFLVYSLHAGLITATLAAVIITAVFNLNNIFFGLAWDMSFLGETASHARRAFFMIDLPHETTAESRVVKVHPENLGKIPDGKLSGDIVFDHFTMSYREDTPAILNDLNLTIPQGKKVGIIGRTGAGKSSIMQSLFRMVYHQAGDIRIGDDSIYGISVSSLRQHFGVVPQDPYLFMGTIRFNLQGDIQGVSDDNMRAALATVGLDLDLDAKVSEGGKDYSVGERQLLCLARLVLLDKQYILMDEPTSSLDRRTDDHIQRLLNTVLADKTVITIAHRLESLEQYDLIIELTAGQLKREGPPAKLIPLLRNQYVDEIAG